ncbi:efflux transporter outer membrane subunit [Phenylobacterium sp.]|uniref:efflux transporter outer membrane subunit n=1 Tax=Phenylobacterium sp. TaxID=1871053 RepID=UPI002F3E5AE6
MTRPAPLLAAALALMLSACAVGPDFVRPQTRAAPTYAAPGDAPPPADQAVVLGQSQAGDWWTPFRAPALDRVITLALANNQDLAVARARLAEAQDDVRAAAAARLPEAALGATAGRQKYGAALFGPLELSVPPFTYYSVGPTARAPLDIFGGAKRAEEAKAAYAEYRGYELEAARLTLSANVAAQALAVAAARSQTADLETVLADDERNVALIRTAIRVGSGTRTQLLSAESQLASDRTLMPPLRQQESTARHALAVLTGQAPADWTAPDFALADFTLPSEIAASLPSELAHRRPDILAAEAQVHAASAAIGVATANLYPKIEITGAFTQQALTPGGLAQGGASAWAFAANLTQPLFNGGRLNAERRAAARRYDAAIASYRQTVLKAFGEVADRLQALANDADQLRAQAQAADTAASALDLARRSYAAGNSGILDVLDAERRLAQAQLGRSQAKAQRLADTVQLYLALGGAMPAAAR